MEDSPGPGYTEQTSSQPCGHERHVVIHGRRSWRATEERIVVNMKVYRMQVSHVDGVHRERLPRAAAGVESSTGWSCEMR